MSWNYERVDTHIDMYQMGDNPPQGYLVEVQVGNEMFIRDRGYWCSVWQLSEELSRQGYTVLTSDEDEVFGCWIGCYPLTDWPEEAQLGADSLIAKDILVRIHDPNYHLQIQNKGYAVNHPQHQFRKDRDTRRWAYRRWYEPVKTEPIKQPEQYYPTFSQEIAKLLV